MKYSDLEGTCCQPLKVPPCSPVLSGIERKDEKKEKKLKAKAKSSNIHKRSKKYSRTVLDLPATDPGSDLQFSSDEELYIDSFTNVQRGHRTLLHSELQRKYQLEAQVSQQMPPELIVTQATHKSSESILTKIDDKDKLAASPAITKFPPISGSNTRRTNSWHSLCIPKIRINNPNVDTTETLKLKLSLKKQIWTGIPSDGLSDDKNRLISWGAPPIIRTKISQIKDDHEALLTACSQKLAAWQENYVIGSACSKNKLTINVIGSEISENIHKTKNNIVEKSKFKMESAVEIKMKKKRNPLAKIAETTQIITRLSKSRVKGSLQHRKESNPMIRSVPTTTASIYTIQPLAPLQLNKSHRFKTGGIVARAVQTTKKKKLRPVLHTKHKGNVTESENEKPLVKKVRKKIIHKKNGKKHN